LLKAKSNMLRYTPHPARVKLRFEGGYIEYPPSLPTPFKQRPHSSFPLTPHFLLLRYAFACPAGYFAHSPTPHFPRKWGVGERPHDNEVAPNGPQGKFPTALSSGAFGVREMGSGNEESSATAPRIVVGGGLCRIGGYWEIPHNIPLLVY
jgi:hypothetical protein